MIIESKKGFEIRLDANEKFKCFFTKDLTRNQVEIIECYLDGSYNLGVEKMREDLMELVENYLSE